LLLHFALYSFLGPFNFLTLWIQNYDKTEDTLREGSRYAAHAKLSLFQAVDLQRHLQEEL
jgi:hypothetical protein